MSSSYIIAALYKFVALDDCIALRVRLLAECKRLHIFGTLLLAPEGINGTIAGSREGIDGILNYLYSDTRFANLEHKEALALASPFVRMKVRLKKEIVTLGVKGIDPGKKVGIYVDPDNWNELISDPSVLVIDTRNSYEYELGTFKNAVDPKITAFGEFPNFVINTLSPTDTRKIAMFCTGGIRCEKASSYLLEQGFQEVYHLKGGILKYLETVPKSQSLWQGECFVFDRRISVAHE